MFGGGREEKKERKFNFEWLNFELLGDPQMCTLHAQIWILLYVHNYVYTLCYCTKCMYIQLHLPQCVNTDPPW